MKKNILVIDDEELITKSLLKLLSSEGYSVAIASSGKDAIEKIKNGNFDLIVSDVRMPELDGIETIKQIRMCLKKSHKKPIPEILITGYADKDKYEAAIGSQVAEYIYKPFDRIEFLKVIKRVID